MAKPKLRSVGGNHKKGGAAGASSAWIAGGVVIVALAALGFALWYPRREGFGIPGNFRCAAYQYKNCKNGKPCPANTCCLKWSADKGCTEELYVAPKSAPNNDTKPAPIPTILIGNPSAPVNKPQVVISDPPKAPGCFKTQEQKNEAIKNAAIKFRGMNVEITTPFCCDRPPCP